MRIAMTFSRLLPLVVMGSIWELLSGRIVPAKVMPSMVAIAEEAIVLGGDTAFRSAVVVTGFRSLGGLAFAIALALPLGLWMADNESVRRNVEPLATATYSIPKAPLIPLVVFWLGMGSTSRILLGLAGAFPPILINTFNGANGVDRELIWSARSMDVGKVGELLHVILPASLPTILSGIRIGMIFSFVIVIASEMIMAHTGLGVEVISRSSFGQFHVMFGVILWIASLIALIDRLYLAGVNYLLRWSEEGVQGL